MHISFTISAIAMLRAWKYMFKEPMVQVKIMTHIPLMWRLIDCPICPCSSVSKNATPLLKRLIEFPISLCSSAAHLLTIPLRVPAVLSIRNKVFHFFIITWNSLKLKIYFHAIDVCCSKTAYFEILHQILCLSHCYYRM